MSCGLYIHIPFCIKKCAYCDFVSAPATAELHKAYFDTLKKEILLYKDLSVDSIFIGGGTPSCVDARYIYDMFECINKNMLLSKSAEITIETNPGTITNEKLGIYKSCGINRISIGAQSMQDSELLSLGRIHSAAQTIEAINMIQKAGFTNYNIDLMLAIPNQTLKSLEDTLNKAVSLCPTHISAYSLIVEEGTPFSDMANAGNLFLPDEDTERGMYEFAVSFLKSHGYNHYEISNFAKQGYECRHNLKYWSCESYIGIGAAAHSYYDGKRYQNTSNTNAYINMINENKGCIIDEQILSFDDMVSEYIIMALRLTEGISLNDFYKRFGFKFEEKYENTIEKYTTAGFLEKTPTHIRFTPKGISVSNSILCEFV
ncbi:MAG: oxygen-independent coproporphyrinogen III oxidase [Ruminococcaceae bacterium]|nr:oxygen-independent coproporphyrinogen III oxidase [Oscillospiraceae bacterium]